MRKMLTLHREGHYAGVARKHQLEGSLTYHVFNRSHCRMPIFDEEEEESFEQLERPMGHEKFLERLMKERGHYFPRRRGRSRKIIYSQVV